MLEINDFNELENVINNEEMLVILFGEDKCNPCRALKNKIASASLDSNITRAYVSLDKNPDLASKLEIFTAPTLIAFIAGKIVVKEAGCFSLEEVLNKLNRYSKML